MNKIEGAITDGVFWVSPEGEKLQENCSKNYSKYLGPSQMANKSHTEITEITDIKRPSQMAGYGGRCAQNYKKIVQKIIQNIRPSQMADKSHTDTTESTEITDIKRPSQMDFFLKHIIAI